MKESDLDAYWSVMKQIFELDTSQVMGIRFKYVHQIVYGTQQSHNEVNEYEHFCDEIFLYCFKSEVSKS